MAFDNTELVLLAHGNDKKLFYYVSSSDTLATINAAGYFNNADDNIRMAAGDLVLAKGSDGTALLEVSSVSNAGSVTTAVASVSGIAAVETASTAAALSAVGITELSSTGAVTYTLSAPFAGAVKHLIKTASSTATITVNAGSGVTFDGTNDDLTFDAANEAVILVGLSATRWGITSNNGSVGKS